MTEQRLAQSAPSSMLSEQQQEQIDRLILQYKRQIEVLENDKETLSDENRELRVQLSQQLGTNLQLEQQIKQVLEQARTRQQDRRSNEDRERIHALEMQVKLFSEDFESEKRDRERAQIKVRDMEREISAYTAQLNALQRSAVSRIQHRRFGPSGHAHGGHGLIQCDDGLDEDDIDLDDVPMPVASSPPMQLLGRNVDQSDDEGEDQIDHVTTTRKQTTKDADQTIPMVTKPPPSDILQCPQCQQEFPTDLHMEQCLQ